MSDIKQALLDELLMEYRRLCGEDRRQRASGITLAMDAIHKHLEDCIIISPDQSQSWRDAVSFGMGIMKDGKVIRPQDIYKDQS